MSKLFERYIREMRDQWGEGYWVTWHPSVRHRLGEIGTTVGGQFVGIDHLAVPFDEVPATSRDSISIRTDDSVDVSFGAGASVPLKLHALMDAHARATVKFVRDDGILAVLGDLGETRIASVPSLARHLVELHAKGEWGADRAVVTHLVKGSGVIVASGAGGPTVEISAGAGVGIVAKLAEVSGEASGSAFGTMELEVSGVDLTPLFRVVRLRRDWLLRLRIRYGNEQPFRDASARTSTVYNDLLEEATDEPEVVVEEVDQLSAMEEAIAD